MITRQTNSRTICVEQIVPQIPCRKRKDRNRCKQEGDSGRKSEVQIQPPRTHRTDAGCCEDMLSSCPNSLPTLFARLVIGLRHNVVDDSGNPCRLPFRYCRQTPGFCALFLTRRWLPLPLSGSQRTIDGSNMSGSRVTGHHPHPGSNPKHFNIIGTGEKH